MEDRIDMVLSGPKPRRKSVPVNLLNPIPGTPFAHNPVLSNDELRRTVAIFRFLIPDGSIRLARRTGASRRQGRGMLPERSQCRHQRGYAHHLRIFL